MCRTPAHQWCAAKDAEYMQVSELMHWHMGHANDLHPRARNAAPRLLPCPHCLNCSAFQIVI